MRTVKRESVKLNKAKFEAIEKIARAFASDKQVHLDFYQDGLNFSGVKLRGPNTGWAVHFNRFTRKRPTHDRSSKRRRRHPGEYPNRSDSRITTGRRTCELRGRNSDQPGGKSDCLRCRPHGSLR